MAMRKASPRHSRALRSWIGTRLTGEKLWRYCDLADTLDYDGPDLRLFVFDRYGHNERELDLIDL